MIANWIFLAILAYFFFAVAAVVDKFILSKKIDQPTVYATLVSLLGLAVLLVAPFLPGDFFILPLPGLGWSLVFGAAFVLAVLFLYKSIQLGETSRVVPVIISVQPIFILLMALILVGEVLSRFALLAFGVILLGAFLISYEKSQWRMSKKIYGLAVLAAFFFGLNLAGSKFLFEQYDFASPFVWIRIGSVVTALFFLWHKPTRLGLAEMLKPKPRGHSQKYGLSLVAVAQLFGAAGVLLVNYSVSIGPVSLVGALQGLQHMFVFILTTLLSVFWPKILKEKITSSILIQKSVAIVILILGVGVLAFST